MRAYWFKTPEIVQRLFSDLTWRIQTEQKTIFLTFDDGPVTEFTPWVLDTLKAYQAKATFFCVGENVKRNPDIYQKIRDEAHVIGNHTQNHLQGWKTSTDDYIENIRKAETYLKQQDRNKLFRPPHGKIKPKQIRKLKKRGYQIIMWDVLSGDFDQSLNKEQCLKSTLKNVQNGSIVVFHDSSKSFTNLSYVLPRVLEHFSKQGYKFKGIGQS